MAMDYTRYYTGYNACSWDRVCKPFRRPNRWITGTNQSPLGGVQCDCTKMILFLGSN